MKLIVVDDDALIRESLSMMLGTFKDIEVVASLENGQRALDYLMVHPVDFILLDIRMPVMDGVTLTKVLKDKQINIPTLVLTTFTDHEYIFDAIKSGANGYILKSRGIKEIHKAIQAVNAGQLVFDTSVKEALMDKPLTRSKALIDLNQKEMSILKCVGTGLNNKEISKELFLSEGTIRNYISQLLEKLSLRDRTQLAIYYVKTYD